MYQTLCCCNAVQTTKHKYRLVDCFSHTLDMLYNENKELIILGDVNINLLDLVYNCTNNASNTVYPDDCTDTKFKNLNLIVQGSHP